MISAGGNVIGGQLQGWASLLDKWAMADAYKEELARQGKYQKQAMDVFGGGLQKAGSAEATKELGDAYGSRLGTYANIDAIPLGFDLKQQRPGPGGAARQAMSESQRANLMKYGDWQFNQKLNNLNTGRALDQIINFAKGTSGVFPYRMYDAQHAWDVMAEAGAAISSMSGGAAGVKSAFGGGPPTQQYGNGFGSPGTYVYPQGTQLPGYYDYNMPSMVDPNTGMPYYGSSVVG